MPSSAYIRLPAGMARGEVLRGGPPASDAESRRDIAQSLHYYPTTADSWLAVVHLRAGPPRDIERNRKVH